MKERGLEGGYKFLKSKLGKKADDVVRQLGKTMGLDIELHHMLPEEFIGYFKKAGLDIEDFKLPLDKAKHRLKKGNGIHTKAGGELE